MGLGDIGATRELMLQLKDKYEIKDFIETGTYYGNTAVWAASHFDNVLTIEYSKEIYQTTVAKYGRMPNINFIFGDSRAVLKEIVPKLNHPAMLWLDSHWCGGQSYGENDECPLIEEINVINSSQCAHFIFIDDARFFTSPPPYTLPHQIGRWPSIDIVIEALKLKGTNYYIVIIEDVIIAVPEYAKEIVARYCQERNTKAWEQYDEHLNALKVKEGIKLIDQGLRLVGQGFYFQLKQLGSCLTTSVKPR